MSEYTPNLHLFKYNPDTDGKEVFSLTQALNNNWDVLDERCGNSRNIGEIVASTIPLTDAGLHLLDGALIQGGGIYSAFVTYIAGLVSTYPNLFVTESAWQSAVSSKGVCGKFVYDSTNNTVRLPKVTGKMEGTTDINALGDLAPLIVKLPNITGSMNAVYEIDAPLIADGAFYLETASPQNEGYSLSSQSGRVWKFDASRSSSVYSGNGTDTTIHEQAVNVFYYIVIATSTKTDIQVDIDEIATDLNGKADVDLTNTSPSSSFASTLDTAGIRTIVETYSNDWSWYRVYSDGWCEQGGRATASTSYGASGTVVFLKEFRDTKYQFFIGANLYTDAIVTSFRETDHRTTSSTGVVGGYFTNYSVMAFYAYPFTWQANGYIN